MDEFSPNPVNQKIHDLFGKGFGTIHLTKIYLVLSYH